MPEVFPCRILFTTVEWKSVTKTLQGLTGIFACLEPLNLQSSCCGTFAAELEACFWIQILQGARIEGDRWNVSQMISLVLIAHAAQQVVNSFYLLNTHQGLLLHLYLSVFCAHLRLLQNYYTFQIQISPTPR